MQSMLSLCATYSLPLCLSGISQSHPLPLSTEMEDHDVRRQCCGILRQALRRQRSVGRDQEMVTTLTNFETDHGDVLHTHLGVTAKAA